MPTPPLLHPLQPFRRRHVALLRQLAAIQHRVLDQSTALGFLWSFLNPLLMLLVLWTVYRRQVGQGVPYYPVYLLIGLVHFTHFSKSTASAMRSLQRMRNVATNVIFPKELLVYSVLLAALPEFAISMALTMAIGVLSGTPVSAALLALPLVIAMQLLLVLWGSLALSMIHVFVRDLDHLFDVGMRILFFVTPIIYRLDMLSPKLRAIALLNPLAQVIGYSRSLVIDGQLPPIGTLALFVAGHAALVYAAVVTFRRVEPALLERL